MPSKYLIFLLLGGAGVVQAQPYAYVSNCCNYASNASVISTSTGTQSSLVKTGTGGFAATISPDGSLVYISNTLSQSITVIQESTLALVQTIPVPGYVIQWMAVNPAGTELYFTSADSATVSRLVGINLSTGAVFATYAPNAPLTQPVVSNDGTEVFVGVQIVKGSLESGLAVLNSSTLAETLLVNGLYGPGGVAISPDGTKLYVSNLGNSTSPTPQLTVIGESTFGIIAEATLTAGDTPGLVSINPSGSIVYACENGATPDVAVFNTANNTLTTRLPTSGFQPIQAAASANGDSLYITTAGNSSVLSFDAATNAEIASIAVPGSVNGLALSVDGTKLFVPNFGSSRVTVVDEATSNIVASIPVGDMTGGSLGQIAVNPAGTYVFATNYTSNNLSVISTATHEVVATVPTGPHPVAVAVLPTNGSRVFVLNSGNNTITVISGTAFTVLNTITPQLVSGEVVTSLVADPGGAKLYVGVFNTTTEAKSTILTVSTVTHATIGGVLVPYPIALGIDTENDELLALGAQSTSEGMYPINLAVKPPTVVTSGIVPLNVTPVTVPTTNGIVAASSGGIAFATVGGSILSVNLSAKTVTVLGALTGFPGSLTLDPTGAELWVANSSIPNILIYSAANGTALHPVALGNPSFGIAFAPE
jgi:YVTN family beta-propeller protein